jgi:hypothetical protein
MRHATWLRLEASPFWSRLYRNYRTLPDRYRAPIRWLLTPRWQLATWTVRAAARNRVVAGPFRGMRLELSPLSKRHLLGYILGSQEIELHDLVERVVTRGYRTILNVGAADGYYAVGLAICSPEAHVVAFETLPELRAVVARAAAANRVSGRVELAGHCGPAELSRTLAQAAPPALIFMDVEGAEVDLLDPVVVPELDRADIVVECHDCFVANCTADLIARFRPSHDIEIYEGRPRNLADYPAQFLPFLKRFFPRLALDLMHERRPGNQHWLFLVAKRKRSSGICAVAG